MATRNRRDEPRLVPEPHFGSEQMLLRSYTELKILRGVDGAVNGSLSDQCEFLPFLELPSLSVIVAAPEYLPGLTRVPRTSPGYQLCLGGVI